MATEDGANLLAGYKRAANILKQAEKDVVPAQAGTAGGTAPTVTAPAFAGATDVDKALLAALDAAEPAASAAVADERFTDAMAALASLRAPIDAFFDGVMVNDPDEAVRAYRLGLLSRFTGAAEQLKEALLVNPYDASGTADVIQQALTMPLEERQARQSALLERIRTHDVHNWCESFLRVLGQPMPPRVRPRAPEPRSRRPAARDQPLPASRLR